MEVLMVRLDQDDAWHVPDELWRPIEPLLPRASAPPAGVGITRAFRTRGHGRHLLYRAHGHPMAGAAGNQHLFTLLDLPPFSRVNRCSRVRGVVDQAADFR